MQGKILKKEVQKLWDCLKRKKKEKEKEKGTTPVPENFM
jgi:hypothetical protein